MRITFLWRRATLGDNNDRECGAVKGHAGYNAELRALSNVLLAALLRSVCTNVLDGNERALLGGVVIGAMTVDKKRAEVLVSAHPQRGYDCKATFCGAALFVHGGVEVQVDGKDLLETGRIRRPVLDADIVATQCVVLPFAAHYRRSKRSTTPEKEKGVPRDGRAGDPLLKHT